MFRSKERYPNRRPKRGRHPLSKLQQTKSGRRHVNCASSRNKSVSENSMPRSSKKRNELRPLSIKSEKCFWPHKRYKKNAK